jgi:hypothetical protein
MLLIVASLGDLPFGIVDATRLTVNVSFAFVVGTSLHDVAFFMHVMKNSIGRVTASVDGVTLFASAILQPSANAFVGSAFVRTIFDFHLETPFMRFAKLIASFSFQRVVAWIGTRVAGIGAGLALRAVFVDCATAARTDVGE